MSKPTTLREAIAAMIGQRQGITRAFIQGVFDGAPELADEYDVEPKKIAKTLSNMVGAGQVTRDSEGRYKLTAKGKAASNSGRGQKPSSELSGNDSAEDYSRGTTEQPPLIDPPPPTEQPPKKDPPPPEPPEPDELCMDLARASDHAKRACQRYIDRLKDPQLEELLELCRHAEVAEANYYSRLGQGAP